MFKIEELTENGWCHTAEHENQDNAFWHARAKSDADGHTYRVISREFHTVCLLTSNGTECWELD
ncbi:MAG: hypothetical protein CMN91_07135 [Synechococcus sp. ARS1019]|nr:hypothetical protein [Synechococcus sp. ARS1019]